MTAYLVYDVFTDRRFGGNQLAVIPDATGLVEDDLRQGEDMGRPSRIGVDPVPGRVTVSGQAVRVMEGRLL